MQYVEHIYCISKPTIRIHVDWFYFLKIQNIREQFTVTNETENNLPLMCKLCHLLLKGMYLYIILQCNILFPKRVIWLSTIIMSLLDHNDTPLKVNIMHKISNFIFKATWPFNLLSCFQSWTGWVSPLPW